MSNTNEILKHIITAPELNSTEYANNLKGVFDNINDNFITLANRDFVKGERGSSVEIVEYDIFDNTLEEPNYTEYGNLLINAIKNRSGYSKNNEYITSNDVTVSLFDNLGSKAGKLKMICNITSEDGINFSYLPVSSLYYVFLDGRFANDKINKMDESVFTDIEDLSCVLIYNINENGKGYFEVLDNAFPTIYYEKEVGLCWKLNGNNTGIPVKGPQGKAGENAKLYIVKSDKEINQSTSNTFEIEITHIFDTNGFTTINDYIKNNTDILKINTQYACAIYCNLGSGYNYYFGTLKYDNNKVIAISDSTIGIDTLVQISTLENLFKNINLKNNDGYNAKGIYLPIEKQGYTQKVHLLTASSISNTEGNDTELNTDIIWSPVSDINTLKIDDSNKLQVDKYLYLKIDTELLTKKLKDVYNNGTVTVTDDFVRIIKNAFKHRNNILKYKLVNVINPNVSDGSIVGSNVFGNYTNNNNVSLNTNNTLNLNGSASAKCLINTKINSYNASGEISDSSELGPVIDITNLKNYGKHINISKDENENTLVHKELKYTDFNNIDFPVYPIGVNKKNEVIGENTTVTPKMLTKENVNEYTVYEEINNIDNYLDRYSNMPFEFGDLIFNNDPNKKGIYRWVLDFTYNEFDPIELKESNSGTINRINSAYNNIFVDDGGASKNINALNIYALFNTIFTTSISPIESDNILWFNGIFKKLTIKGDEYLSNSVEGWELNPDIFKFYKFNPAFNNSYSINQDTSLNLNYNVNITGDKENPKKNITVHGNVISENLQVFDTADINKIKNIYTENDIIGKSGLKLGKINDTDDYNFSVNKDGSMYSTNISSDSINSTNISSDSINSTLISTTNINITDNELEPTFSLNVLRNNTDNTDNTDTNYSNGIILKYNYINSNSDNDNDNNLLNNLLNNPNICVNKIDKTITFNPTNISDYAITTDSNTSNESSIEKYLSDIIDNKNSDNNKTEISNIYYIYTNTQKNTINRINVNENTIMSINSGNKNKLSSGCSGSGYGIKGHADGPYYSDWENAKKTLSVNGSNYCNLYKKARYYRNSLFPYWDIPGNSVTLMSTPMPYTSISKADRPYITNICQVEIPFFDEKNNNLLAGLEIDENNEYIKMNNDDTLSLISKIILNLNNHNFTFFTGIFANNGGLPHMINDYTVSGSKYYSYVNLVWEYSIIETVNDKECEFANRRHYKLYDFPNYLVNDDAYKNNIWTGNWPTNQTNKDENNNLIFNGITVCKDLYGENTKISGNNTYLMKQFNFRPNDISIEYWNILHQYITSFKNHQVNVKEHKPKFKIKVYTETVVSFYSKTSCMRECWLTPMLYYTAKNTPEYTNKGVGITENLDWDSITLTPTYFWTAGNKVTNASSSDPFFSFDYLDKLCFHDGKNNTNTMYLDIGVTDENNKPCKHDDGDSIPKSIEITDGIDETEWIYGRKYGYNGFNGNYNGNFFNLDYKYNIIKATNPLLTSSKIDINSHGIIIQSNNNVGGIFCKDFLNKKEDNSIEYNYNDFYLFTTTDTGDNTKGLATISISSLINLAKSENSQSILTYGV